jgi:antitoxin ParD1/3/4
MNVNLGDTLDQFITDLLQSGLYQSQSEVVREGLRLLKEREDLRKIRLVQLRSEIDKGIQQLNSGDYQTHDGESLKKVFQDSKARGRKKLADKKVRAA